MEPRTGKATDGLDPDLVALAADVFATATNHDAGALDEPLWRSLENTGLARLTLPAALGGGDGTLLDAAAVLIEAGAAAARVPLVETDLTGGWLAARAGLAVPDGPLAVAVAEDLVLRRVDEGWEVSGTVRRVGWARTAAAVVVLDGSRVLCVDPSTTPVEHGRNLAGEPRDTVVLSDHALPVASVADAPPRSAEHLRLRAALGRSLLITGAIRAATASAVRYAGERVQFGRPIARLQAVQQQLALAAGELAAATAAAVTAAVRAEDAGFDDDATFLAVAAAKARTSEAAGTVARIAHQVHGAIGFTDEHPLRHATTRLWAWRDEDGGEDAWNAEVGRRVLLAGGTGLWSALVGE
jgi:acyl-CoA dehydrogenase